MKLARPELRSLSMIVTMVEVDEVGRPPGRIAPPVALVSVMVKYSSISVRLSSKIGMRICALVWPDSKVTLLVT